MVTKILGQVKGLGMWARLDFENIARSYDVLHLTARGEASTRFIFQEYSLCGWDVESSLTFNLNVISNWKSIRIANQK